MLSITYFRGIAQNASYTTNLISPKLDLCLIYAQISSRRPNNNANSIGEAHELRT